MHLKIYVFLHPGEWSARGRELNQLLVVQLRDDDRDGNEDIHERCLGGELDLDRWEEIEFLTC